MCGGEGGGEGENSPSSVTWSDSPDEHGGESGIGHSIEFLNGWKRDVKMGHSLSLNGKADGEPLSLAMTSGLMAARQGLNQGDGSTNPLSDVDSVGGNVPNLELGLEYEDETDEVGEAQERNEEGVRMGGCGNL